MRSALTRTILGVDPGRDKCGVAVQDPAGVALALKVVRLAELGMEAARLVSEHDVGAIALGGSTGSREVRAALEASCPDTPLFVIDERGTTELARRRWWTEHPPRGLWTLVPTAWRVPPGPVDHLAALILAEMLRIELATRAELEPDTEDG